MVFCEVKSGIVRFYSGNDLIRHYEEVIAVYVFKNGYSERIADVEEGRVWNIRDWIFENGILKILV